MSATKELFIEACENLGYDPTGELNMQELASVQCEMGRLLATKAEGVVE